MKRTLWLLPFVSLVTFAEPDFQALTREREAIETRYEREQQKIDQARERAMIPVHDRVRSLESEAERALRASYNPTAVMSGKIDQSVDTDKIAKAQLATLEVRNLENNKLTREAEAPFTEQNQELSRRRTRELAVFETKLFGDQEAAATLRAQAIKRADITAKWQEKIDALSREEQKERDATTYRLTTKINELEASLFVAQFKHQSAQVMKVQAAAVKNSQAPDFSSTTMTNPEIEALTAKRDDAKNALATALEELSANYSARGTDIQNGLADELAKVEN